MGATPDSHDRVLPDAVRRAGRWLVPLTLLSLTGAAANLAFPAALGHAVDRLVARSDASGAVWWCAALLAAMVVVDAVSQLVAGSGTATATGALRHDLVRHMLGAGPALTRRIDEGDLVARLVGGTATAAKAVVVVSGLAATIVPPLGAVLLLTVMDWPLGLTMLVGGVLVSRPVRTYLRDAQAATAAYLEAQAAIATRLVEALGGARTIAAARTTQREVARTLAPLDDLRRHGVAVWRNIARLAFRGEPVVLATQVAVIVVAGARLSTGHLTPGELVAAGRYAVIASGIGGILDELGALTRARASAGRLSGVLAEPVIVYGTRSLPPGEGRLELRGVTAGVDGGDGAPQLDGLDLVVPGGAAVALVGSSGGGKSLLAAVAGRLCNPAGGEVLLDGVPMSALDHASLRGAVAYAFERPVWLPGTVADTIGVGAAAVPGARVREAARLARADGFVARLPDGYEARLDTTPLSGGELQRLGLARAFAQNPRLLILDDATSSLDTATEAQIAHALTNTLRGRTRLIITHRRATAAQSDLVAWLEGGRIRACAPHQELWLDPDYRAIFGAAPDPLSAERRERRDEAGPPEPGEGAEAAPVGRGSG